MVVVVPLGEAIKQASLVNKLRNKIYPLHHNLGIGKIIGYIIFICYFTLLPQSFKLIWPYLLENYNDGYIYGFGLWIIVVGGYIVIQSAMYVVYHLKHPFFEKYKNTDRLWPWQQNLQEWKKIRARTFKLVSFNFIVVAPFMIYLNYSPEVPYESSLEKWPTPFKHFWQFLVFAIHQDLAQYFLHRLLHHPKLYWIHKVHHEYKQPVSISSHYFHPIQYIGLSAFGSTIGFRLLSYATNVHISSIFIWMLYRMVQASDRHSGYTFTWSTLDLIPYSQGPDYHEFHHTMNDGNYGQVLSIWDALFKSQDSYVKFLKKQLQKQSQNIPEAKQKAK